MSHRLLHNFLEATMYDHFPQMSVDKKSHFFLRGEVAPSTLTRHNEGMKKALIIKTDGTLPTVIEIPSQTETYQVIKDTVASPHGDWFDCVRGESFHGYVNDTGLIDGLPMNPIASILFGQVLCGDVILFGSYSPKGEYDGDEYDIPEWVVANVRSAFLLWKTNADAQEVRV